MRHSFLYKSFSIVFVLGVPLHINRSESWPSYVVCRTAHVLFTLFVFVCVYWFPTHIVLWLCFACLRLVCPVLPVSLDCSFCITPLVFSNVYLIQIRYCSFVTRYYFLEKIRWNVCLGGRYMFNTTLLAAKGKIFKYTPISSNFLSGFWMVIGGQLQVNRSQSKTSWFI